jgi:hypothetical protein
VKAGHAKGRHPSVRALPLEARPARLVGVGALAFAKWPRPTIRQGQSCRSRKDQTCARDRRGAECGDGVSFVQTLRHSLERPSTPPSLSLFATVAATPEIFRPSFAEPSCQST